MADDALRRRIKVLTYVSLGLVIAILGVTGYAVYWLLSDRAPRTTLEADYKYAKQVFDLKPNDAAANERMGAVLVSMGRYAEGERYYLRAIEIAPKDPRVWLNLAQAYQIMGRDNKALETVLKVIKDAPKFSEPEYLAGQLYEKKGDLTKAKAHLVRAVELEPSDGDAMFLLGQVLLKLGDKQGAAEQFKKVKSFMADYPGIDAALKAAGAEPAPKQ